MGATAAEAHDFIRWDVLSNLSDRLIELGEQARDLADNVETDWAIAREIPGNVKTIREYLDALDVIGWYPDEKAAS